MSELFDKTKPKAVVLVSGGLDSSTVLAMAVAEGFECYCLSFDYGQRHRAELHAAEIIASQLGAAAHKTVSLGLDAIGGSSLTDTSIDVPSESAEGIPNTYVPARNTVFLSIALGWAEVLGANAIFIGVNAVDYSGYPDCRPEYIESFQSMANLATKTGVEGVTIEIKTPLIQLTKSQIIKEGTACAVPYGQTVSCYQASPKGLACGVCDSCRIRKEGFFDAGLPDPTRYFSI